MAAAAWKVGDDISVLGLGVRRWWGLPAGWERVTELEDELEQVGGAGLVWRFGWASGMALGLREGLLVSGTPGKRAAWLFHV